MDALNNRGAAAPGPAAPERATSDKAAGANGGRVGEQAQGLSHREFTGWLRWCVRLHELQRAISLRLARFLVGGAR